MYNKFVVAHELGHAIADGGSYHMKSSNYNLAVSDTNLCNCPNSTGTFRSDSSHHCLTSTELIRAAQNEGFAHFMSNALFNNRDQSSAYWGYCKYALFDGSEGDTPTAPPITIRTDTRKKWMEVECNSGNQAQGTGWDWMTFFWELHSDNGDTGSTRRWSVSEVLSGLAG
jgi:hypothetical protein